MAFFITRVSYHINAPVSIGILKLFSKKSAPEGRTFQAFSFFSRVEMW